MAKLKFFQLQIWGAGTVKQSFTISREGEDRYALLTVSGLKQPYQRQRLGTFVTFDEAVAASKQKKSEFKPAPMWSASTPERTFTISYENDKYVASSLRNRPAESLRFLGKFITFDEATDACEKYLTYGEVN